MLVGNGSVRREVNIEVSEGVIVSLPPWLCPLWLGGRQAGTGRQAGWKGGSLAASVITTMNLTFAFETLFIKNLKFNDHKLLMSSRSLLATGIIVSHYSRHCSWLNLRVTKNQLTGVMIWSASWNLHLLIYYSTCSPWVGIGCVDCNA